MVVELILRIGRQWGSKFGVEKQAELLDIFCAFWKSMYFFIMWLITLLELKNEV